MYVKKLDLYNFRNYDKETVLFDEGLNIVVGKNAQGKTNLIESVYLLATGTSPRIVSDKELIKMDAKIAKICALAKCEGGDVEVEMVLSKSSKKCASVNGMNIAKIGELIGNIRAIYFSPDEMSLIKDSPEYRRKFMDIDLSQINRQYFYCLNKYNKILKQRNTLLKEEKTQNVLETLEVWDSALSKAGAWIIVKRREFCERLSNISKKIHRSIADNENLEIVYQTSATKESENEIAEEIKGQLLKNRERDIRLGFTSIGPQRDDIKITLNGVDLRTYGSQGQQRTSTLSLKLAEIEIFKEVTRENPILLLDDVLSELDEKRRLKLLEACKVCQTIITCTEIDANLTGDYAKIAVENGKANRIK